MSVTISGVDEVLAALDAVAGILAAPFNAPGVADLASEFAIQLEEALQEAAPKRAEEGRPGSFYTDPGEFAAGIEALARGTGASVTIEASAVDPLMTWIVGGTRPHDIWPRLARHLRFPWHGEIVYRNHVFHPGTRPNPFEEEPGNVVADEMLGAYADAIEAEVLRAFEA